MFDQVVSLGTDLEEVSRFKKYANWKELKFLKRVFSEEELDYCLRQAYPERHLAARFSAKEAVYKAINQALVLWNSSQEKLDYFKSNFFISSIEVTKVKQTPQIKLTEELSLFLRSLVKEEQDCRFLLSISHTKNYAIAQVIFLLSFVRT